MLHKSSGRMKWNGLQTSLVRNLFVSPEIMLVDAISSARSIYATTLSRGSDLMSRFSIPLT
ncbi:MAG: hypothetical protein VB140_09010 [Burkholderia sp.]